MKILFCSNVSQHGFVGPARFTEAILKINDDFESFHEIRILTDDIEADNFPFFKLNYPMLQKLQILDFVFKGWAFYKCIKNIQKEFDPDVVIFGNAMYGLITKIFFPRNKVIAGMVNDYNIAGLNYQNFLKTEGGRGLFPLMLAEYLSVRNHDVVFVCSFYLKNLLSVKYRLSKNVNLLYQSVNIEKIPFALRNFDKVNIVKILFVKNRFKTGGLEDLANALLLIPRVNFLLTVIGPYQKNESEILQLFEAHKNTKVIFMGPVSQELVMKEMQSHHILCVPSRKEGQGLANIEGMASGLSIVTSCVGGIPEVVDGGHNGWMCLPENPESLANCLSECIHMDNVERQRIAQKARKFVEDNFNYPLMLNKMLIILKNELDEKK